MDVDLDTFLTTVYVAIAAWCATEPPASPHPGPHPKLSDAEVLTLMVVGTFRGHSERALLRWADTVLRPWFPVQLSQSAFNRRARVLAFAAARLLPALAVQLGVAQDTYEVVDTVPVPVAQRCRGDRRACFTEEETSVGRGGVGKAYYYGVSLLLSVAASGPITGLVVAPANVQERWPFSALLSWRDDPTAVPMTAAALASRNPWRKTYVGPTGYLTGPATVGATVCGTYLADRGFAGQVWHAHWREDLAAEVWTPDRVARPVRHWFHHARQVVETINGVLTDVLHLKFPHAHTYAGLITRIVTTCATVNLGILVNRHCGRPDLALGTLFPG